jgi:polyamine oxidase
MFTALGDEGLRVESLTDAQVITEITAKLKAAYPLANVSSPTAVYVPKWSSNPFFKGAYSFRTVLDPKIPPKDL